MLDRGSAGNTVTVTGPSASRALSSTCAKGALLFASQVDHDDKEHAALNKFGQLWKDNFASDSLLVFSTGRSHALYEELRVGPLEAPDALQAMGPRSKHDSQRPVGAAAPSVQLTRVMFPYFLLVHICGDSHPPSAQWAAVRMRCTPLGHADFRATAKAE